MRPWLERRGGTLHDYVFPNRNDYMAHMSTRQDARLVHEWLVGMDLEPQEYGTHSLPAHEGADPLQGDGQLARRSDPSRPCQDPRARCATLVWT